MEKKNSISMGIGLSTLMMIFTVLCLTIFGTLSFMQGKRNLSASERIASNSKEYLDADYSASLIYKDIKEHKDDLDYLDSIGVSFENDLYKYNVTINSNKRLDVELDSDLNIVKWCEVSESNGSYDYEGFVN